MITVLLWLSLGVDLIHISDSHVVRFAGVHPELALARSVNEKSMATLEEFVSAANALPKATVVHTGDIVDATCFDAATGGPAVHGQVSLARSALKKLKHPVHLALGNHDVECYRRNPKAPASPLGDQTVASEARREWGSAFGKLRRQSYYSARLGQGYRLIVLDNGESPEVPGAREFYAAQMKWLAGELEKRRGDRVVVAFHIPLGADARSKPLVEALIGAPQVVLLLCGHRHSDDVSPLQLTDGRKVMQVRTAALSRGASTWRRIRLGRDAIEISATGEPGRVLQTVKLP